MTPFPLVNGRVALTLDPPTANDGVRSGLYLVPDDSAVRAATGGIAAYQWGLPFTALGQLVYTDATAGLPANTQFVGGLPVAPAGLCISSGAIAGYVNGVPYTDSGAVAATNVGLASGVSALLASFSGPKVWYDMSDTATLFQTAGGNTPVTAAGQPIGMILDKAQGLVRGPELLLNGDFSAGATSWTVTNQDSTHIATFSGGTLRYQSDTTSPQLAVSQSVGSLTGKFVEVRMEVSNYVSGQLKLDTFANAVFSPGNGVQYVRGLAVNNSINITRSTVDVDITIESISVRELAGVHQIQSVAGSRPLWQPSYSLFDGIDDGLLSPSNFDFTASDEVTIVVGVRRLVDTPDGKIAELGSSNSLNGMFYMSAPGSGGVTKFEYLSRGDQQAIPFTTSATYNAPFTGVATGISKIATPVATLRVNGVQVDQRVVTQGIGNFGAYPLYVGRRNNSGLPFNGRIYGIIIIGRLLTAPELALCEQYMAQQCGITI